MMKLLRRTTSTEYVGGGALLIGLWMGLSGCGSNEGEALLHQIDDAQGVLDELWVEVDAHAGVANDASALAELQNSEATHDEALRGHLGELEHGIGDMGMCGDVDPDLLDSMIGMHGTCDDERGRHHDAMMTQSSITDARAEEQRHQVEMTACLREFDGMMDQMRGSEGTAMCRHHHGMDAHNRP